MDYNLFDLLEIHLLLAPGCLDAFPTLQAYRDKMAARPKISAYRQTEGFKTRAINGNNKQWLQHCHETKLSILFFFLVVILLSSGVHKGFLG